MSVTQVLIFKDSNFDNMFKIPKVISPPKSGTAETFILKVHDSNINNMFDYRD